MHEAVANPDSYYIFFLKNLTESQLHLQRPTFTLRPVTPSQLLYYVHTNPTQFFCIPLIIPCVSPSHLASSLCFESLEGASQNYKSLVFNFLTTVIIQALN